VNFARGTVATTIGILALLAIFSISGCPSGSSPDGGSQTSDSEVIFTNMNVQGVSSNPTAATTFTISRPYTITRILNYHWNDGQGTPNPGTIALTSSGGTTYGPWQTTGSPGQGNVPNVNWTATPNEDVPAGTYTVVDSEPSTWSHNADSGNRGITHIEGIPASSGSTTPSAAQTVIQLNDFNTAATDFVQKHYNFVDAAQKWEGTPIEASNLMEALASFNSYTAAANEWVAAADRVNELSTALGGESGSTAKLQPTAQGIPVPGGPLGPNPLFVKFLGDRIGQNTQEVQDAIKRHPNYEVDPLEAEKLMAEITDTIQANSLKELRVNVSAFAGVGGAVTTGGATALLLSAGVITVSAPATIVIGGAALIGGGITSAIAWWWSAPSAKCSSVDTEKALTLFSDSDVCSFAAGSVGPGNPFPNVFPDPGGTLTISIPGYLPVTITNFQPPADGKQLTIDFPPVPITEGNVGQTITVDFSEIFAQESLTIPVKTETVTYDDPCAFSYPPSLTMVSSGGVAGVESTTSVHDLRAVDDHSLYAPPMRLYAVAISGDSVRFTFDVSVTPDTSSSVCGNTTYDRTVISASYILDAYDSVDNMRIVETITSANGKFEKTFTRSDNVDLLIMYWRAEVTVSDAFGPNYSFWEANVLRLGLNYE
jgi:hypothetical protein